MKTRKMLQKSAIILLGSLFTFSATAFAADKLVVQDTTGTTDTFKVDETGQVSMAGYLGIGLGTTVPMAAIQAKGASSYASQIMMLREETNANGGAGFIAYHNNANTAMPASGDRLGYFLFGSYYKDTTNQYGGGVNYLWAKNGGGIAARADGAWTYTSIPTYFTFETAGVGSTTRAERLRIGSDGKIKISNLAGTYGGGSAYVCVNNTGDLFTSETACP